MTTQPHDVRCYKLKKLLSKLQWVNKQFYFVGHIKIQTKDQLVTYIFILDFSPRLLIVRLLAPVLNCILFNVHAPWHLETDPAQTLERKQWFAYLTTAYRKWSQTGLPIIFGGDLNNQIMYDISRHVHGEDDFGFVLMSF